MKKREDFVKNLEDANDATVVVNDWFRGLGFDVEVLPYEVTPDEKSRYEFTDDGDIKISKRIEVKHWKHIDFQSLDEVPYNDIIVDEKYKIDKRNIRTLHCYVILNKSKSKCLVIKSSTRNEWFHRNLYDSVEGAKRDFYLCPKRYVKFYELKTMPR